MLLDAISKAGTIALGGHVRPDGDCEVHEKYR